MNKYTSWDRARLSVVVPIGVIVAVAIVCIVVAVLSSAQRADEVAVEHEKTVVLARAEQLRRTRAARSGKRRRLRAGDPQHPRQFDPDWAKQRVGLWLKTYFDHDYVFIFDGNDKPVFSQLGRSDLDASWFDAALADLESVLAFMRGRDAALRGALRLSEPSVRQDGPQSQAAVIRSLAGRPAVIAAVAVGPVGGLLAAGDNAAPIVMSVKFIDNDVLAGIASQLRLTQSAQARNRAGAAGRFDL